MPSFQLYLTTIAIAMDARDTDLSHYGPRCLSLRPETCYSQKQDTFLNSFSQVQVTFLSCDKDIATASFNKAVDYRRNRKP